MDTGVIKLSQKNFHQICRICYQQNDLKDIFRSTYQDISLATILELFVPQKISEEDGLPTHACLSCIKSLLTLNAFMDQYRVSTEALRSVYNFLYSTENLSDQQKRKRCIQINYTKIPSVENLIQKCNFPSGIDIADAPQIKIEEVDIKVEPPARINRTKSKPKLRVSCPDCEQVFYNRSFLKIHYKTQHPKPKQKEECVCYICKKIFYSKPKLLGHINACHTTLQCPHCDLKLTKGSYKIHIKRHEPGYVPIKTVDIKKLCTICGKSVKSSKMRCHMLCHEITKPFHCKLCPFKTAFKTSLRRHQIRHQGKPLLCNACGKDFSRKEYFTRHMELHVPFQEAKICNICSETMATPFDYGKHMQSHESFPERMIKFQKRLNSQTRSIKNTREKNNSINIEEPPLMGKRKVKRYVKKCEECGLSCIGYATYILHMRVKHQIDKRVCTFCGERVLGHMSLHMMTHNGKPIVKCVACDKTFRNESHLRRHNVLIHENKREHKCPYCGKGFNLPNSLQEHIRTHTGETIQCNHCDKTFKQLSTRYKHLREVHNVRLGPPRTQINNEKQIYD